MDCISLASRSASVRLVTVGGRTGRRRTPPTIAASAAVRITAASSVGISGSVSPTMSTRHGSMNASSASARSVLCGFVLPVKAVSVNLHVRGKQFSINQSINF